MSDTIIMPDFIDWASHLTPEDVALALHEAFKQGRALGYREGYDDGHERGWQEDWDNATLEDLRRFYEDEDAKES